jgi:hypothetical protein
MEFTSFSIEACEPAADGGVVPGLVPIPNVDPDALEEAATTFRTVGEAIEESGEGITSAWASLTGVYVAPEADTLLSVLDPVSSDGTSVATGVRDAATALESFAETARELKSRLTGLKAEAEAFRADVGWDEEWLEDEDERDRNNDLNNRIALAVHEFQEAERDCANKIGEHYGGTWFTGHSDKAEHDQTSTSGDRTYQIYGTMAARTDQANPWGSPVDAPTSALEDAFWGLGDIVVGAVVGLGIGTGLYRDGQAAYPFGTEHGQNLLANWEDAKTSFWALTGSNAQDGWASPGGADAQYENARGPWIEVGDSIVPVSEWDDRPMYTITNGAGNTALMLSPMGWARTFLDNPDLGSGSAHGPDGDGPLPVERGPNGVSPHGSGLHGTDTVNMSADSPTTGQPDPGTTIGGMHEALAGLESQLGSGPAADPGVPAGSPDPVPTPETSNATPTGDAPTPTGGGAPPTPAPEPATVPSHEDVRSSTGDSAPTAQELRDGTSGSDADTATDPWAVSPVNDDSTRQESPTAPVAGPADGDGSPTNTPVAIDDTNNGTGTNGGGVGGNGPVQNNGQNGIGDDQDSPTPTTGGSGTGDKPPQDTTGTGDDGSEDDGDQPSGDDKPNDGDPPEEANGAREIVPSEVLPGGSLTASEGVDGGHAIERHVGVSIEYLKDRTLGNIPNAPSGRVAGSYHDLQTADLATAIALEKNSSEISSWLQQDMSIKSNRRKLLKDIEINLDDLGYAVRRLGSQKNPTGWEYPDPTHVTIMLAYEPGMPPHNFRIHTSYPAPAPDANIQLNHPTVNQ